MYKYNTITTYIVILHIVTMHVISIDDSASPIRKSGHVETVEQIDIDKMHHKNNKHVEIDRHRLERQ